MKRAPSSASNSRNATPGQVVLDDGAANVNKTARDEENAARLMAEML